MSSISDIDLDLENLFQPAWAQEKPATNRFERFTGNEGVKPERRFNDKPGERRAPRRDSAGGGGERRGGPPRGGSKFGDRKPGFSRGNDRRDDRSERRERPEPPPPLPEITVTFVPGEKGVEQLARQIKMTGRAIRCSRSRNSSCEKPERYSVQLAVKKKSDGTIAQQLFVCALDDTPWLSEDEAVAHVLKNHFATFYQAERTATEPPKGTYTFVAQCGMSGVDSWPAELSRLPEPVAQAARGKIFADAVRCFQVARENREGRGRRQKMDRGAKFQDRIHLSSTCRTAQARDARRSGETFSRHAQGDDHQVRRIARDRRRAEPQLRSRGLQRLIRAEWEQQKYFPLTVATKLSQQFASHGLQFFKVNKTVTHVAVARPQFLDLETTPVSESIKRIVEFINAHPKCTRRKLIETLAPSPKPTVIEVKPDDSKASLPSRRRNRRRLSPICTGSCIRVTFWNLPTANWKRPKNRCPDRRSRKRNRRRKARRRRSCRDN